MKLRLTLQLDARVPLEALLVNRLERLPKSRRQAWLRGLLVQGFLVDCQLLRMERTRGHTALKSDRPPPRYTAEKSNDPPAETPARRVARNEDAGQQQQSNSFASGKPFAALAKIIG